MPVYGQPNLDPVERAWGDVWLLQVGMETPTGHSQKYTNLTIAHLFGEQKLAHLKIY